MIDADPETEPSPGPTLPENDDPAAKKRAIETPLEDGDANGQPI